MAVHLTRGPVRYSRTLIVLLSIALTACNLPGGETHVLPPKLSPTGAAAILASLALTTAPPPALPPTASASPTASQTPTGTATPSPTRTPTETLTPTPAGSPTPSLTPTFDFPDVTVKEQANCRYGPGTAYLYSHGLYAGDRGEVHGRNAPGTWLWIKPENLERHCWVAASVVEVRGEIFSVAVVDPPLPRANALYSAPKNVRAVREGNQVTVTWKRVNMTQDDDRGYLLEVYLCQDSALIFVAVRTDDTRYTFTDEPGCKGKSGGLLYTVEKHGYPDPVEIPWPRAEKP